MTADFETRLTAVLDDVAGTITPRADFDAVRAAAGGAGGVADIRPIGGAPRPFRHRRRGVAAAAAALLLVAGGAAAFELADDSGSVATTPATEPELIDPPAPTLAEQGDEPKPADEPEPKPADEPKVTDEPKPADEPEPSDEPVADEPIIERVAKLGLAKLDHEPPIQWIFGRAPAGERVVAESEYGRAETEVGTEGEWQLALELIEAPVGVEIPIVVAFSGIDRVVEFVVVIPERAVDEEPKDEEPKDEEPKDEVPKDEQPPAPIAFTATLGWAEEQSWGMKIGLWGAADPGAVVELGSKYGSGRAEANAKGEWQMIAELEMPPGSSTTVVVEAVGSDKRYEFVVERPSEPVAEQSFSATTGSSFLDHEPPHQWFYGTGVPGSIVVISSEYGTADGVVRENGEFEIKLLVTGASPGTVFGVQVSNSASDKVFGFELTVPAEPQVVEFTANAAFADCDEPIPFNEYWGTAQPGTTVLIISPYGSAERTAGENGGWEARVEFAGAPFGETFIVSVKSVATGQIKEFPMTVLEPPAEG